MLTSLSCRSLKKAFCSTLLLLHRHSGVQAPPILRLLHGRQHSPHLRIRSGSRFQPVGRKRGRGRGHQLETACLTSRVLQLASRGLRALITTEKERVEIREYITVSTKYYYPKKLYIPTASFPQSGLTVEFIFFMRLAPVTLVKAGLCAPPPGPSMVICI